LAEYDSWDIAGYGGEGDWYDVESGDTPLSSDEPLPDWVDEMVIHLELDDGSHAYVTIWGPWDDWDGLEDYIDEIDDLDRYADG
jgi:hypothetical protein